MTGIRRSRERGRGIGVSIGMPIADAAIRAYPREAPASWAFAQTAERRWNPACAGTTKTRAAR